MDYDASDSPPASKTQAEDTDPHTDAMPYEDLLLVLDPRQMFEMADSKYVRIGGLPGASDIKTYDSGNLSVSTIGNTNTSLLGELHVRYAVIFEVPVLESTTSAPANNSVAIFGDNGQKAIVSTTPFIHPLDQVAPAVQNGLGAVNTTGSLLFPAGNYCFAASCQDSWATSGTVQTFQVLQNGVSLPLGAVSGQFLAKFGAAAVQIFNTATAVGYFSSTGLAASAITLQTTDTFTGAGLSEAFIMVWAM